MTGTAAEGRARRYDPHRPQGLDGRQRVSASDDVAAAASSSKVRKPKDARVRRVRIGPFQPMRQPEQAVILVVDDDPDTRIIYSGYLRAMGCEVFTANDGHAAAEKAKDLLPDLIVMDLAMPRVDGWEATRRLRDSSWTRLIPIVAVSAVPVSRETAFEAGCNAYLSKPCEPQLLWSQIRALLKAPSSGSP